MMYRTCTVQTNLDFSSEADMVKKLRVSLALQPVATALFANSPFTEGKLNGYLSFRSEIWRDTDPDRTGMLPWAFEPGMGFERWVDYALDVPMYFIKRGDRYIDVAGQSFRDLMAGKLAGLAGRARDAVGLGQPPDHDLSRGAPQALSRNARRRCGPAAPARRRCRRSGSASCTTTTALDAAWDLVKDWTAEERQALRDAVPKLALRADDPRPQRARPRPGLPGAARTRALPAASGSTSAAATRRAISQPLDDIVERGVDAGRGADREVQRARGAARSSRRSPNTHIRRRMAKGTPATLALHKAGVAFTLHEYDYDPNADRIGLQAAAALGVDPARLLKTLMTKAGGAIVCVLVPSDREVSLKKLAAALGAKEAAMLAPAEAERVSGYHVGGISPFGQKKRVRVFADRSALGHATVLLNGGRRGLQIEMAPADLVRLLDASVADLC